MTEATQTTNEDRDQPTDVVEHLIGDRGLLQIRAVDGEVRIRGVDGDTARVVDREGKQGVIARRGPGRLEVTSSDPDPAEWGTSWGGFLAGRLNFRLGRGWRRPANFDIDLPRGARLEVDGVRAIVQSTGLAGPQRYRTISGDVDVTDVSDGPIVLDSVSGDLTLRTSSRISLQAKTISARLAITAPELTAVDVQTTSGDAHITGRLLPGEHRITTVSGDAVLATEGGLTVDGQTISGDMATDLPHRSEGGRGRRRFVVGDGAAHLTFKSMSGDLAIMAPGQGPGGSGQATSFARPNWPARPSAPPRPSAPARPSAPTRPPAPPPIGHDPRIDILQALERGEIDVDEAGRRLTALEASHD